MTLKGCPKPHKYHLATDQAAVLDNLGVRTGCNCCDTKYEPQKTVLGSVSGGNRISHRNRAKQSEQLTFERQGLVIFTEQREKKGFVIQIICTVSQEDHLYVYVWSFPGVNAEPQMSYVLSCRCLSTKGGAVRAWGLFEVKGHLILP